MDNPFITLLIIIAVVVSLCMVPSKVYRVGCSVVLGVMLLLMLAANASVGGLLIGLILLAGGAVVACKYV